jgi:hypothetical protein
MQTAGYNARRMITLALFILASGGVVPEKVLTTAATRRWTPETFQRLPLNFEFNRGQADAQISFIAHASGYSLFLKPTEAVFQFPASAKSSLLRMQFAGANAAPQVTGLDELPGKINYFIGNDPRKWHTNIPNYSRVHYRNLYPGVDLTYYGQQRRLEYDFVVAPGFDPRVIQLVFAGAERLSIDGQGDLLIRTSGGEVRQHKPVVYQQVGIERRTIDGRYVRTGKYQVGFEIAEYDATRPLVIDPVLVYSTYFGSANLEFGNSIAVDTVDAVYITGKIVSTSSPQASPGFDPGDAFVMKINASGNSLAFLTYFGGNNLEEGLGITTDITGTYVTGSTASTNFPTLNPYQSTFGGGLSDAFVAKLDPTGCFILYSTYLGGSGAGEEKGLSIAVDSANNALVTGKTTSTDFPRQNPLQSSNGGGSDAFVTKFNASGSDLLFSTYLGGSGEDEGFGIAVDSADSPYVTGRTSSENFPVVASSAYQTTKLNGFDAFVTRLNLNGSLLLYSTYLGGSVGLNATDEGRDIAVDSVGNAYVTGDTESIDFPITAGNAYQTLFGGVRDAFVAKINTVAAGAESLVYSTYLGGSNDDGGMSIAVGSRGDVHITGSTSSGNFPVVNGLAQQKFGGIRNCPSPDGNVTQTLICRDAFVAELNTTLTGAASVLFSTYLGGSLDDVGLGIAVDSRGNSYVTGFTSSSDFPLVDPMQPGFGGGFDAFVARIAVSGGDPDHKIDTTTMITSDLPDPSVVGEPITISFKVTTSTPGPVITGTVVVTDGRDSCSAAVAVGSCKLTPTTAGTRTLTATYAGDSNFKESVTSESHVFRKADTTTTITSHLPDPSVVGQEITVSFRVDVRSPGSGAPTGSVTISDGISSCTTRVAAGSCALRPSTSGRKTLTATYAGDGNFNESSGTASHLVERSDTTTAITSDLPDASVVGQKVTVNFSVTANRPGAGTPTGTVTISDGTDSCAASAAIATCMLMPTVAGRKTLTATYSGDSNFNGSSGTEPHLVNMADTATMLVASPNPSSSGQEVAFTATVGVLLPGAGKPTGSVTFRDGSMQICAQVPLDASGQATCRTSSLSATTHSITAEYGGDGNFKSSTSPIIILDNKPLADLSVTLTASPNTFVTGSIIVYTITVTNDGPDDARQVTLRYNPSSQLRPANTAFQRLAQPPPGWVCDPMPAGGAGSVTCTTPLLARKTSAMFRIEVQVGCPQGGNGSSISSRATVGAVTLDPMPGNNSAAVVINGVAQARLVAETPIEFRPAIPAGRASNPSALSITFTVENTGCAPLVISKSAIDRITDRQRFTNTNDCVTFPIERLVNGQFVPACGLQLEQSIGVGLRATLRLRFDPVIPARAGGTSNLLPSQVLPDEIRSQLTITHNGLGISGSLLQADVIGRITTALKLINPDDPKLNPLVIISRSGDEFTVECSVYDSNMDVNKVVYQFLDRAGNPVDSAIEVPVTIAGLVRGQSFTIRQRFTGAEDHPEVAGVRVTVFDTESSETATAATPLPFTVSASLARSRMVPGATLVLPVLKLRRQQ